MSKRRSAFSLFELLVILALLGLLFALLLPAIAKARQSAVRMQSQNNLKQIGLAAHNYHDTHDGFPPGVDKNGYSASALLLPYLEQDALFRMIDFKKPVSDDGNKTIRAARIQVYISPNDPLPMPADGPGPTNYLFCAGSKFNLESNNGVFYTDSKVRFSTIIDGTSNTIMTGEALRGDGQTKAVDVSRQHVALPKEMLDELNDDSGVKDFGDNQNIAGDRCAAWIEGKFLYGTFTATRTINNKKPDVTCDGFGGLSGLRSVTTYAAVGMCDGSVRTMTDKVALPVWTSIASRNGGEVVPDF